MNLLIKCKCDSVWVFNGKQEKCPYCKRKLTKKEKIVGYGIFCKTLAAEHLRDAYAKTN